LAVNKVDYCYLGTQKKLTASAQNSVSYVAILG